MLEAEKTDDGRLTVMDVRRGSAAAAWAVAWSLLLAFVLLVASGFTSAVGYGAGRTSGVSMADRMHVLSLSSREGSRQTVSVDRKSAPCSRLDPPVALAGLNTGIRRGGAWETAVPLRAARLHAFDPVGYDCRGPPSSTT